MSEKNCNNCKYHKNPCEICDGFDAWEVAEKSCNGCFHEMKRSVEEPCSSCNWDRNKYEKYVKPVEGKL